MVLGFQALFHYFARWHVLELECLVLSLGVLGIEPMFDRGVCFGLLFTSDDDLGCT